jgi:hypothetical protein
MSPDRELNSAIGVRKLRDPSRGHGGHAAEGGEVVVAGPGRRSARQSATSAADPVAGLRARGLVHESERPKRPRSASRRIKANGLVSDLVAEQRR